MRSSTNAYLTALAIADLLYLLCVFWLSLRHYPFLKETPFLDSFFSYVFPYSLWLTDAASTYCVAKVIRVKLCIQKRARSIRQQPEEHRMPFVSNQTSKERAFASTIERQSRLANSGSARGECAGYKRETSASVSDVQ